MLKRLRQSSPRVRWMTIACAIVIFAGATTTLALGAGHARLVNPDTTVSYTGDTSGPIIEGVQNGNGDGAEGVVGATAGGIGMFGFENNSSNQGIGLAGIDEGPSSTGLLGQDLNANAGSPGFGLQGVSSTGVGLKGESLEASSGVGVLAVDGTTGKQIAELGVNAGPGALAISGSGIFFTPGVDGESSDQTGEDAAGVFGLDAFSNTALAPDVGVLGYGDQAVLGYTMNTGTSNDGAAGVVGGEFSGVSANTSDFNAGVRGFSPWGVGVLAEVDNAVPTHPFFGGGVPIGLYAVADSTGTEDPLAAVSIAEAQDTSTWGPVSWNSNTGEEIDTIVPGATGNLMNLFTTGSGADTFDDSGNETLPGHITTAGGTLLRVRGHSGRDRMAYGVHATVPTMEDFGEAQMMNGRAYVRIDADLADSMAAGVSYLVFITPEGDSDGVYVTNKTPSGFEVRENRGAHDSLAFSYRIVTKPNGIAGERLAMAPQDALPRRATIGMRRSHPTQTPSQRAMEGNLTSGERVEFAKYEAARIARNAMLKKLPTVDRKGNIHLGSVVVKTPQQ
jgi:hypothetical protein